VSTTVRPHQQVKLPCCSLPQSCRCRGTINVLHLLLLPLRVLPSWHTSATPRLRVAVVVVGHRLLWRGGLGRAFRCCCGCPPGVPHPAHQLSTQHVELLLHASPHDGAVLVRPADEVRPV
jgi:hypothetical protein